AAFRQARAINEALIQASPEKPRYRADLAGNLESLALALDALGQPKVEETFRAAIAIYEKLVAAHPDNVDYRIRLATCLRNQGAVRAKAGRVEPARSSYRRALAQFDTQDPKLRSPVGLRTQAELLSNLGNLHGAGAEAAFRSSIALSERL